MLFNSRKIRGLEKQCAWLAEQFYRRERLQEDRFESRVRSLEAKVEVQGRIIEFLRVFQKNDGGVFPAEMSRSPTDLSDLIDEPSPREIEDDLAMEDDFPGDLFPPASTLEFDEDGELEETDAH
jgi:hypothetical protein